MIRKPLQSPYDGPYKVIEHTDKYFVVEVKGKQDTISLDWLKPTHLDAVDTTPESITTCTSHTTGTPTSTTTKPQPTARVTRLGRHVHCPVRFST